MRSLSQTPSLYCPQPSSRDDAWLRRCSEVNGGGFERLLTDLTIACLQTIAESGVTEATEGKTSGKGELPNFSKDSP